MDVQRGGMSRRDFLRLNAAGALAVLGSGSTVRGAEAERPLNVLFMAIDDLNDWIGCLGGHPDAKTPHLDRLAARGVLFTRAYCAAPACNPSRAALMTGIRPSTSGVYHNPQPWRDSPVLKDIGTLPQVFRAHGYSVRGSGKIYHGSFPDAASWDEYWPSQKQNKPPDPLPPRDTLPLNGIPKTSHFDWGPVAASDSEMGDSQVADWVIGELQKEQSKPFFLACGFFRPHLPWYVPQKYFDLYPVDRIALPNVKADDLDDVPAAGKRIARPEGDHAKVLEHGQWRKAVQAYLASISFVDTCVGRVLDGLDRSPHRDRTLVVLWSDHGWHLGEKLHWRKFALWEEATHNVLMMTVPGLTRPGGRCQRPVNLLDIFPTLLDVCGLPAKPDLEGLSLRPWLRDPGAPKEEPAVTTHGNGNHTVRSERWRYIRYADGSEELYDHDADDLEWVNLAADPRHDAVKTALARWLPAANAADVPTVQRQRRNARADEE